MQLVASPLYIYRIKAVTGVEAGCQPFWSFIGHVFEMKLHLGELKAFLMLY